MEGQKSLRPILVIDGFNCFLRYFFVSQEVTAHSQPIGGAVGFIKFLNNVSDMFCPSKIFVVWEAGGPSPRRKKISPNYKTNRTKIKEIRKIQAGTASTRDALALDEKNRVFQLTVLSKLLKTTPTCQVFIPETEADDIIGYLVQNKFKTTNAKKIIVSNDKDFYQLLEDPNIEIYDQAKKNIITGDTVLKTYGISARNFCLAKSLSGDPSDNIEGIPGVGFKTLSKRFEILSDSKQDVDMATILNEARKNIEASRAIDKKPLKVFTELLGAEELLRRNWKLIYLNSSNLSASQISKIDFIVDTHEPKMDKLSLIKTIIETGINTVFDYDQFCSNMRNFMR